MSKLASHTFRPTKLTAQQDYQQKVLNIKFMETCPFYAYMMHAVGELVPTLDVGTAATDGKHVFYNPDYLFAHKVSEQVFILAHEMDHLVKRHPQRFVTYDERGKLRDLPWDSSWANICADLPINAGLIENGTGSCNPDWLFDPKVKSSELWEDLYERTYNPPPGGRPGRQPGNQPGGGQPGNSGSNPGQSPPSTYKEHGGGVRGQKGEIPGPGGDRVRGELQGGFDLILPPPKDPITGQVDLPDEGEFLEAIARAHVAAKAMGRMPANLQRFVEELLAPQVDWKDHIRMLVAGKIGSRHETWARPNRRRLVTQPMVIIPGKRGYGAERVVIGIDTSGSIGNDEYDAFWAEVSGVLKDCKPREIVVIGCDARVLDHNVHTVTNIDDFDTARMKGLGGGGGTSFIPVFEYVEEHNLRPECLIYLTDMYGSFPEVKPAYDVIWAATTDKNAPWGEHVRINIKE